MGIEATRTQRLSSIIAQRPASTSLTVNHQLTVEDRTCGTLEFTGEG